MCYIGDRYSLKRSLRFVHFECDLGLRLLHIPIDIDYARRLLEDLLYLACDLELPIHIRSVDLSYESLHDRRSGRHLADLNASAERQSQLHKFWSYSLCNLVTL